MITQTLTTIKSDILAVEFAIINAKAKINSIENNILYCNAYAKMTPVKDSAVQFKKRSAELTNSLPRQKRQLLIFEIGYRKLLNKFN